MKNEITKMLYHMIWSQGFGFRIDCNFFIRSEKYMCVIVTFMWLYCNVKTGLDRVKFSTGLGRVKFSNF